MKLIVAFGAVTGKAGLSQYGFLIIIRAWDICVLQKFWFPPVHLLEKGFQIFVNLSQMFSNGIRERLQHIIRGTVIPAAEDHCTATRNFLCASFSTSQDIKRNFESQLLVKKEQEERLIRYADNNNLWVKDLLENGRFLAQGGESKVFLDSDHKHVVKINDGVF